MDESVATAGGVGQTRIGFHQFEPVRQRHGGRVGPGGSGRHSRTGRSLFFRNFKVKNMESEIGLPIVDRVFQCTNVEM